MLSILPTIPVPLPAYNTNKFLKERIMERKRVVSEPYKKHLTIIACHLNTNQRIKILKQNLYFLSFSNNDIIIINSSNLLTNTDIKNELQNRVKTYIEIQNNKWIDFGKWGYILNNVDYSQYEFITFTNDSFSILRPIDFYFKLAVSANKELYGYTSSSEVKYHIQSYLFTLKKSAIDKFKEYLHPLQEKMFFFNNITPIHLELNLINIFTSTGCFLNLGQLPINYNKNVFFNNDSLYSILWKYNLLPFIKIKRINKQYYSNISMTFSPRPSYLLFDRDSSNIDQGENDSSASSPFSQYKFNRDALKPDIVETFFSVERTGVPLVDLKFQKRR